MAPPDPILNLATRFKSDTFEKKVNLGIGAYRTEEGKPWILDSVRAAEKMVVADTAADKEYQPIDGKAEYKRPVQELIFPAAVIDSGCVATLQALSGTGSLQMIAQFMKEMGVTKIHGPIPTWGNHPKIFNRAGLEYAGYPYWHQESRSLDFDGMTAAMMKMNEGEAILLHAVAHNPTGVDPTPAQWRKIVELCQARKLIPLLDNAYQGYASGDLAKDGLAQTLFTESGMEFFIAQSFAKNFGLYGERIGYIHVKCATKDAADRVLSQLKICVRQAYSSPPKHGAAIVYTVLSNRELKNQWLGELKMMSDRIVSMRHALRNAVEAKSTPGKWNHITDQIGMFTFTGLIKEQVARMVEEFHIYMTGDGRISMAGLNPSNVQYVADCINDVVTKAAPPTSIFANVKMAPPDPILNLATRFKSDTFEKKVNLGIGAYRTEEGKPWILDSVRAAEKIVVADTAGDKEYQPIDGKAEYKRPVQELIFPAAVIDSGCIATLQALSGTGSLQMIAQFMKEMGVTKIHGPIPTWGNHPKIFNRAGLEYAGYPYWHQESRSLDFDGMTAAMTKMNEGEAILLHAVAHNPTGVDPTPAQWRKIVELCQARKLIPLLDNAYQGYASGDLAKDGLAQTLFTESGMEFFIAQSFAKNFGLYGERVGYIHVKCATKDAADRALSQLKICVRQAYSSPPKHGAAIVYTVLSTPELKKQWLGELKMMSDRIVSMRSALRRAVEAKGTPGTWNHITDQIGMFTFTGLDKEQVTRMVEDFHIYMTGDGRISMAGLNPGNVEYVADCIHAAVKCLVVPGQRII